MIHITQGSDNTYRSDEMRRSAEGLYDSMQKISGEHADYFESGSDIQVTLRLRDGETYDLDPHKRENLPFVQINRNRGSNTDISVNIDPLIFFKTEEIPPEERTAMEGDKYGRKPTHRHVLKDGQEISALASVLLSFAKNVAQDRSIEEGTIIPITYGEQAREQRSFAGVLTSSLTGNQKLVRNIYREAVELFPETQAQIENIVHLWATDNHTVMNPLFHQTEPRFMDTSAALSGSSRTNPGAASLVHVVQKEAERLGLDPVSQDFWQGLPASVRTKPIAGQTPSRARSEGNSN